MERNYREENKMVLDGLNMNKKYPNKDIAINVLLIQLCDALALPTGFCLFYRGIKNLIL